MGSWGVQLYDSDVARDVRDLFAFWARIPSSATALAQAVARDANAPDDPASEDYADIWLALADQLHVYGLHDDVTFERARSTISEGLDLKTRKALGEAPHDAARRKKALVALLERWSTPHPRPKPRNLLDKPEPHTFAPGAILAYPTCGGEPRNYADVSNRLGWFQDGWGSAVVLATGHVKDWFAWSAVARLSVHGGQMLQLASCLEAAIENQPWAMNPSGAGTIAIQVGALPLRHCKRMGMVVLGRVELEWNRVKELDPVIESPKKVPASTLFHVLTWWGPGVKPLREQRDANVATPSAVVPLRTLCR